MTDMNNLGVTQSPLGARLPRFLSAAAPQANAPAAGYPQDAYVGAPAGGNAADPAAIQQQLASPNPADRFRAVVAITNMPPQQAIPLLQMAAQNDNPQVRDLANQALGVMQRMPGTTPQQPAANQPGAQPQPQQPYQPQPQQPYTGYQPTQAPPMPQYTPAAVGNVNPQDAAFMIQTLAPDLNKGPVPARAAIQQLMAYANASPQSKEAVMNLLLNHIYHRYDDSVGEAIKALGSMNDPRALPYIEAVQRKYGLTADTQAIAKQVIEAMRQQGPGGPGTASVGGQVSVELIRMWEGELTKSRDLALPAFNNIRNALGPDPKANTPQRQEIMRVLITHIATRYEPETVVPAIQLLGQMGSRDMNCLQYLDALKRRPGQSQAAIDAATAAIQQIMQAPPR